MFTLVYPNKPGLTAQERHTGITANKAAYKVGTLLKLVSGTLAVCAATDVPEFICVGDRSAESAASFEVPVIRIDKNAVYETTLSVASSSIAEGAKYTTANGTQITATTTNGVAEVVSFDGKAAGDTVRVRF